MAGGATLVGMKELLRKFKKVSDFVDEGAVETAALKAAKVIESDARRRLRAQTDTRSGKLEKSLRSERPKRRLKGFPGAFVMAGGRGPNPAPHAHLVEFGHAIVRGGRVVGHAPPYPFFRPAVDGNRSRVLYMLRKAAERELKHSAKGR